MSFFFLGVGESGKIEARSRQLAHNCCVLLIPSSERRESAAGRESAHEEKGVVRQPLQELRTVMRVWVL